MTGSIASSIVPSLMLSIGLGLAALTGQLWSSRALAEQLTISAAASLAEAFKAIGPLFEAQQPGVTVRYNFAASGVLLQQIVQGAPVDVLASADQETVQRGIAQNLLVSASRQDFARNTLVLIEPARDGQGLTNLESLRSIEVKRIAIGKTATVPAGRYARQVLEAAGMWPALEAKLVLADNVRQVLDYVGRGEVEAGFVYRTDAARLPGRVRVVAALQGHVPIRYPAAVVRDSDHKALAGDFIRFLQMAPAQDALRRHGFDAP